MRIRPSRPPARRTRFPAVSHEPRIQQLSDDLEKAGLHPFHAPCGILLDEGNMPYSRCVRCDNCDGFPCLVHAKSDAEVIAVRPALEQSNVTLRTGAEAIRLECNAAGSAVTGVVVDSGGVEETFRADIVVVSCGAANSAKLLLASASDKHPHGLANGSGQLGRNYMFHNSQAVLALSKEENPTIFQKTLGVNDFYFSGGEDFPFPLGNIQMVGKSQAPMFRGEKPGETRFAPQWTLRDVARHAVDFWLSTEDLPTPENRVTLARDGNIVIDYTRQQRPGQGTPLPQAQGDAGGPRDASRAPPPPPRLSEERDPGGRVRASGGHVPVRHRPVEFGAERRLPGP